VVSSSGSGGSSGSSRRTIGPSADELAKLAKPELTGQLRKRGLRVTGGKAKLVEPLLAGWGIACSFG
jgi:hypothetical protein